MIKDRYFNLYIYLFPILFFMIFREVDFFTNPRFWAEEGSVYFYYSYYNGLKSIFYSHQGYYSLIPNIMTYIATHFTLKTAPLVTTLAALVIHLIPHILVYYSKSEYLNTKSKKILASVIIMFVAHTGEIWLNTITSQFHFIVVVFLILIDKNNNKNYINNIKFYILIFISGLSGVPANVLAPFFILNYIHTKNRINLHYFYILLLTSAIQITYILLFSDKDRLGVLNNIDYSSIVDIVLYTFQYPIFYTKSIGIQTLITFISLTIIFKLIFEKIYFKLFFLSSIFLSIILVLTSIGLNGGSRYSYAPSIIFILGLTVVFFDNSLSKRIRILAIILVFISIFIGIYKFPIRGGIFFNTNWLKWSSEVKEYVKGHKNILSIYPQWEGVKWTIDLSKRKENVKKIEYYEKMIESFAIKPDSHPWNKNTIIMGKNGISVYFRKSIYAKSCSLSLDNNDKYLIRFKLDNKILGTKILSKSTSNIKSGLLNYQITSKIRVLINGIDIIPISGDGHYSIGHLRLD